MTMTTVTTTMMTMTLYNNNNNKIVFSSALSWNRARAGSTDRQARSSTQSLP